MHPPIRVWVYWSQKGITHYISFIIHAINFFTITFQVIRSLPQSSVSWPTASQSPCKEYYRYIAIITLTDSDVHLVPAGTMLFLYVSQITLHAVMRRWMKQKRATSTVKHELNVSWIDICPDVVIGPAANLHMNNVNLSLNICCASYPIPELYIQIEHRLASCCYVKYLQLWKRAEKIISSYYFLPPLLSERHKLCTVQ